MSFKNDKVRPFNEGANVQIPFRDYSSMDGSTARAYRRAAEGIRGRLRSREMAERTEPVSGGFAAVRSMAAGVRGLRSALVLCLTAALVACGGGGGSNPAPSVAAPAPKAVQVSIFGDSTMAGTQYINGQYVVTKVLRADLEADLQAQLGASVTVIEDDQLGTTMADLLNGAQGFQPFATYLQTDKSPIVVENFGINDRLQGFTGAQFQQNLNQFIAQAQASGKTVVLEEPNPICVKGTNDQEQVFSDGQTIQEFVTIVDNTAQVYGLALIKQYEQIKAMPNFCTLMSDGWVHPTAALYQIKAQNQANVLVPIIRKFN